MSTATGTETAEAKTVISAAKVKKTLLAVKVDLNENLNRLNEMYKEDYEDFEPLELSDLLSETTEADFLSLTEQIAESSTKGLPLTVQLENVSKEIDAHWQAMPIKGGKAVPRTEPVMIEWNATANKLLSKETRLKNAIAKAKADAKGETEEETEEENAAE